MLHRIAKFIYFKVMRWRLEGQFPKIDKCVIIVVPHTHWLDFPLGLLIRKVLNEEINYIGKKSLFKPPFGFFFRALGGTPVDRTKSKNMVQALIDVYDSNENFIFAISPEGTRKKVSTWKTGFYHIAAKANVPIACGFVDYYRREIGIGKVLYPSGDMDADMEALKDFYRDKILFIFVLFVRIL